VEQATNEFAGLIQRVRGGCPAAKEELYRRYGDAVRRVVSRKLRRELRRQLDSVDVAQSVWASFFLGDPGRYCFSDADSLVAFLVRVASNKIVDQARYQFAQARDVRRERSLEEPGAADGMDPVGNVLPDRTHTPSQYAMAGERWRTLTHNLSDRHVRILELLRAGHSQTDVAREVGCDPETIRRLLDRLREMTDPS
jgi:RNA polymerase sigma factor (sigma-70 family)